MTAGPTVPDLPAALVARLTGRVEALMPAARRRLEDLVRVPGVSAAAFDQGHVQASAEHVAELLRAVGLPDVQVLSAPRPDGTPGAPAVVARRPAPVRPDGTTAPTVLLYAHHDVQPPGDRADWSSDPFEPVERDGRLFGRGAADDKAGVVLHVTALQALADELGVGVTVFVEGEEEIGSPSFGAFLAAHRDALAADVIVVADSGNWKVGVPALTTSLRGLVDGVVEVRTLDHAVHSGMFGGPVPDALLALVRVLDRLWHADGSVAVPGLHATEADDLGYAEADLRADAGVLDGVRLMGTGLLESRLWTRPSLTVIGVDAPTVATASNTLAPVARAKLSLRVAPGQDPAAALAALTAFVQEQRPFGAQVTFTAGETGSAWQGTADGPVHDVALAALRAAWGTDAVHMGLGGSIPFISDLQAVFPDACVLVTGVEDPDTRAHGADESLHLGEFARAVLAETLLLAALGGAHA